MAALKLTPQTTEAAIRDALAAGDTKLGLRVASNFLLKVLAGLRADDPEDAARITAEVAGRIFVITLNVPGRAGHHTNSPLSVYSEFVDEALRRQP